MMKILGLLLVWILPYGAFAQSLSKAVTQSKQLIVVVADHADSFRAIVQLYEKKEQKWKKIEQFPAVIGEKGIAKGIGEYVWASELMPLTKKEGDRRSPAGIFQIGKYWGYSPTPLPACQLTYQAISPTTLGIDDPQSVLYNQIIDTVGTQDKDYQSFEQMKRPDQHYRWLFEIRHNSQNIPQAGSLIFFHIWEHPKQGTWGCTAVAEANILKILRWLKPTQNPVIIQTIRADLDHYKQLLGF